MKDKIQKNKGCIVVLMISLCMIITSCETGDIGGSLFTDEDREKAIKLVSEANLSLKRIKALYRNNKSKVDDLKAALNKKDVKKVKELADDLSLIILDGYALAETAQEKIEEAQYLKINDDWKEYLNLKAESLEMQIKAFDSRNASAKLLRDKFGGENKIEMQKAAATFKKNEKEFFKNLEKAKKLSSDADKLRKRVNNKRD